MKKIVAVFCAATVWLGAEEVKLNGVQPDGQGSYTIDLTRDPAKPRLFFAGTPFPVSPSDYACAEFDVRVISDTDNGDAFAKIHAGFRMMNQAGKTIHASKVYYVPDSLNTLAAPAQRGDTTIKLVSPWKKCANSYVAFDAREDGSDIPNESVIQVKGSGNTDRDNQLTLCRPLPRAYPAGTRVRRHFWGSEFSYVQWPHVGPWRHVKVEVSGAAKGCPDGKNWWPTTCSAQIQILAHSYKGRNLKLQIRKIRLTVCKSKINQEDIF